MKQQARAPSNSKKSWKNDLIDFPSQINLLPSWINIIEPTHSTSWLLLDRADIVANGFWLFDRSRSCYYINSLPHALVIYLETTNLLKGRLIRIEDMYGGWMRDHNWWISEQQTVAKKKSHIAKSVFTPNEELLCKTAHQRLLDYAAARWAQSELFFRLLLKNTVRSLQMVAHANFFKGQSSRGKPCVTSVNFKELMFLTTRQEITSWCRFTSCLIFLMQCLSLLNQ